MKEAKGQKAYDSFEIVARALLFRPTFTVLSPQDAASVSSVHALVGPVLTLLDGCENARYLIDRSSRYVFYSTHQIQVPQRKNYLPGTFFVCLHA